MKIFNKTDKNAVIWYSKVNFVDENNVVLGYDTEQQCCEYAGWFISDNVVDDDWDYYCELDTEIKDMPGWVFDTGYFKNHDSVYMNDGGMVVFRIINGDKEKFIHLFNCHNGYYSHGFEFKNEYGNEFIKDGSL